MPLLFSENQSISAAADGRLAMIAPFCTLSALFWTFTEICRRENQAFDELLYVVNEIWCQGCVPRL